MFNCNVNLQNFKCIISGNVGIKLVRNIENTELASGDTEKWHEMIKIAIEF